MKSKYKKSDNIAGFLFISPLLIGFIIFMLGPLVYALYMSLFDWPLLGDTLFVGLDNYKEIFANDPEFKAIAWNTVKYAIGLVPLNLTLALCLALLLKDNIKGAGFFRTTIFVPVVTSLVIWAIVWKYMLAPDSGFINVLLDFFNIEGPNWLFNESFAMPAVIVVSLLKNVGLNMILFLIALQQVPQNLYEAAELDGAKKWTQFWRITIPMIVPTIFLTLVTTMIGAMKVFSQIYVMTRGGPVGSTKVIVYAIWESAFQSYEMGYAAALAFILFFVLLILTLILWQMRKRWTFHEQ